MQFDFPITVLASFSNDADCMGAGGRLLLHVQKPEGRIRHISHVLMK